MAFHIIKALEQEISNLSARREQLEAQNASLWNSFKGLEPYQAEGRAYLLTPAGQQTLMRHLQRLSAVHENLLPALTRLNSALNGK